MYRPPHVALEQARKNLNRANVLCVAVGLMTLLQLSILVLSVKANEGTTAWVTFPLFAAGLVVALNKRSDAAVEVVEAQLISLPEHS